MKINDFGNIMVAIFFYSLALHFIVQSFWKEIIIMIAVIIILGSYIQFNKPIKFAKRSNPVQEKKK